MFLAALVTLLSVGDGKSNKVVLAWEVVLRQSHWPHAGNARECLFATSLWTSLGFTGLKGKTLRRCDI